MIFTLISLFWLKTISQDIAPHTDFNHSANWRTAETEHFYIHFENRNENSVAHLLKVLEPMYQSITKKFDSHPSDKVHIVFSDNSDISNGLSTPIPYNLIYLYVAPPSDDSSLDSYDDWLKTLISHEFTHTVHIDEVHGLNRWLRYLFGRIIVPNAIQQQWGLEGLAELQETLETTKGRGRSPYIDMVIRTSALEKKFLPIEKATYWNPEYPYGGAAYSYGIGFYNFLMNRYGEQKIYDLTKATSSSVIPGFLNFKTAKVFGKSFSRLWSEWEQEEEALWAKVPEEYRMTAEEIAQINWLQNEGDRLEGRPVWNSEGTILYAPIFGKEKRGALVQYDFKSSKNPEAEILKKGLVPGSLSYADSKLYYSKNSYVSRTQSASDIWEFDLKTKKEKRLTKGLRLRDPVVFNDSIYAVRIDDVRSSLIRLSLKDLKDPVDKIEKIETLFRAQDFDQIAKPSISPSGKKMVFTSRNRESRQIYIFDLNSHSLQKIISEAYIEAYDPQFTSENEIIFSGYHFRQSNNPKLSFSSSQLFSADLENLKIKMLTRTLTGFTWPAVRENKWAAGLYENSGFRLLTFKSAPYLDRPDATSTFEFRTIDTGENKPNSENLTVKSRPYDMGSTLLPHFLLPYFFYTESDTALGFLTGSNDPLQKWSWSGSAFHRTGPNRPGGGVTVTYQGLNFIDLFISGAASIYDYGQVLATIDSNGIIGDPLPNHYYERSYLASFGYGAQIYTSKGPSPFSFTHSFFYQHRGSLLKLPPGIASGVATVTSEDKTQSFGKISLGPETGYEIGTNFTLDYKGPVQAKLTTDYSPKFGKDSISQLVTVLSLKKYYELFEDQIIALRLAGGLQWLDPIYQRTFRLGGSFGESPFVSVNKQLYSLRGLDTSYLRGEGIVYGSLEYRFGILKHIPGFGTAPIWFKNLSFHLFSDAGQTFNWKSGMNLSELFSRRRRPQEFDIDRFSVSTGLELQSSISLSYGPPLLFRLGYGQMLLLQGKWIAKDRLSQTYFSAGASF